MLVLAFVEQPYRLCFESTGVSWSVRVQRVLGFSFPSWCCRQIPALSAACGAVLKARSGIASSDASL